MIEIFNDVQAVLDRVGQLPRPSIVAIDGNMAAGKSTLAERLASATGDIHINVDDYVEKNKGGYFDFLKISELGHAIQSGIDANKRVFVDGICVKRVLEKLGRTAELHVYVKAVEPDGKWYYGLLNLDPSKTADDVIAEHREQDRRLADFVGEQYEEPERELVADEVIRYHYSYLPHERCDIAFSRPSKSV